MGKKKKYLQDPATNLIIKIRTRLWDFMKSEGTKKTSETMQLLGCTPEFLRRHIEQKFTPEMSWDNYGTYWHLDHIYPLSRVNVLNEEEFKRVCHYTNLQPLSKIENLRKGNNIPGNFVQPEAVKMTVHRPPKPHSERSVSKTTL